MQAPGVRLKCVETRISGSEVRQGALSVLATLLSRNEICVDVESYVFHFKVFVLVILFSQCVSFSFV